MIVVIIVAVILVILGVMILIGKGDHLIAGYNIASEQEKAKYHVWRLRGLIGGLLIALAPITLLMLAEDTKAAVGAVSSLIFVLCIVVVILANTWAKK